MLVIINMRKIKETPYCDEQHTEKRFRKVNKNLRKIKRMLDSIDQGKWNKRKESPLGTKVIKAPDLEEKKNRGREKIKEEDLDKIKITSNSFVSRAKSDQFHLKNKLYYD